MIGEVEKRSKISKSVKKTGKRGELRNIYSDTGIQISAWNDSGVLMVGSNYKADDDVWLKLKKKKTWPTDYEYILANESIEVYRDEFHQVDNSNKT